MVLTHLDNYKIHQKFNLNSHLIKKKKVLSEVESKIRQDFIIYSLDTYEPHRSCIPLNIFVKLVDIEHYNYTQKIMDMMR